MKCWEGGRRGKEDDVAGNEGKVGIQGGSRVLIYVTLEIVGDKYSLE